MGVWVAGLYHIGLIKLMSSISSYALYRSFKNRAESSDNASIPLVDVIVLLLCRTSLTQSSCSPLKTLTIMPWSSTRLRRLTSPPMARLLTLNLRRTTGGRMTWLSSISPPSLQLRMLPGLWRGRGRGFCSALLETASWRCVCKHRRQQS